MNFFLFFLNIFILFEKYHKLCLFLCLISLFTTLLFHDIPQLEATKARLLGALQSQHIAHAQLFFGTEGSANLAMALAYATYLHCENPQAQDACGSCAGCKKHQKLIHPDMHFVFPTAVTKKVDSKPMSRDFIKDWREVVLQHPYFELSNWLEHIGASDKQGNISVEESREIVKTLSLKPFEGAYKILLIWLPEMMNVQSANALLKILEEPPPQTVFLLVSQDVKQMLVTIISRVQMVQIPSFTDAEVSEHLMKQFKLPKNEAEQIAYLADGNMNRAYHLRYEGAKNDLHDWLRQWLRDVYQVNWANCLTHTEAFDSWDREQQKQLLEYFLNICRECLMLQASSKELLRVTAEQMTFIEGLAKTLPAEKLYELYALLGKALYHLERNANTKLLFFDLSREIASLMRKK